jgi:F-type H+-transporting ATPase subunit epsilon
MSAPTLQLVIATPFSVLIDEKHVLSLRAEDDSGSFGVLPGHTDFLTVLSPSALQWRTADGNEQCCVISEAIFRVSSGSKITIACREATLSESLQGLREQITLIRAQRRDAIQRARVSQTQLQARAVRQLAHYLHFDGKQDVGHHQT